MSSYRMLRAAFSGAAAVAFVLFGLVATTGTISAHERRNVGKYTFVVGFNVEPAFANEMNAALVRVTDTATSQPVAGVQETLKVEVTQGANKKEFPLRALSGTPGSYIADFIPTRPGQYTFRFFGTVGGDPVNETFESGPGRFNDVTDAAAVQFPAVQAATAGATADSSAQLTQLTRQVASLDQTVRETQDAANTARTVGFAGLIVGIVGIAAAGYLLLRGRGDDRAVQPANR